MIKKPAIILILTLIIMTPIFSSEPEKLWGISKDDLINKLKLENYSIFRPEDKPDYNNKIIDFFTSMNPEDRPDIIILRTNGIPETDYCFFNSKLYSISEQWGDVDKTKVTNILKILKGRYPELSTDKKKPDILYNFRKEKTKVLLYEKVIDEKSSQVRVFYYTISLFSILLSE